MIFIGIDPGVNGAIVAITPDDIMKFIIPKIDKEVDLNELHGIFLMLSKYKEYDNLYCVMENVHAIYGSAASSTFKFGWVNGVIEAFLSSFQIPYTKVNPKKWQKEMFEGVPANDDKKKMSEMACKRMYPDFDLRPTERSKVAHDGICDALLMATYAKRNFK